MPGFEPYVDSKRILGKLIKKNKKQKTREIPPRKLSLLIKNKRKQKISKRAKVIFFSNVE